MSSSKLIGGRLCLDFVNTVSWRGRDEPDEKLRDFDDLLEWCTLVGVLSRAEARNWRESRSLARAWELRESIYRLFVAWAAGRRPSATDLTRLNASLPPRDRLSWGRGRYVWKAGDERILGPIAWSAADLLTSGDRARLKRCGSEECGWLFYDESVNGRRRWCSMSDCGNREKARRHYARSSRSGSG